MSVRQAVGLTFVIAVGVTIGSVVGFFIEAFILMLLKALL